MRKGKVFSFGSLNYNRSSSAFKKILPNLLFSNSLVNGVCQKVNTSTISKNIFDSESNAAQFTAQFILNAALSRLQKEMSKTLSYSHSSEEESRQMEEILRLEREIERLQKQQEDSMSLLGDVPKEELRRMRDAEIYRLEKEASRVATEFLDLLDFGGLEPSLSSEENLHDPTESTAPLAEEEVDEGFPAEDECIPLPDFPPLAKVPLDKDVLQSIPPPPPAFAEGQMNTPSSSNLSPLTPNGLCLTQPQTSRPPAPPAAVTNGKKQTHRSSRGSDFEHVTEGPSHQTVPDTESDYDQEEFEEAHGSSGASTNDGNITDEEVLRKSGTQNSLDSFRGSSDSVRRTHFCQMIKTQGHDHVDHQRFPQNDSFLMLICAVLVQLFFLQVDTVNSICLEIANLKQIAL